MSPTIYTIGHSNTSAGALAEKLRRCGVRVVVDVRRHPSSRRHPQFNRPALAALLAAHGGIDYRHEEALGGRRPTRPDSPHSGLPAGLRSYADHMAGTAFRSALDRLSRLAAETPTALMCAEADPERCHRSLLADALVVAGMRVVHILAQGELREHRLHPLARVTEDGTLLYPDSQGDQLKLFPPLPG